MEKVPVIDPKAGKPTPVPVRGVDTPVAGEGSDLAAGHIETPNQLAENEGLIPPKPRSGSVESADGAYDAETEQAVQRGRTV